MAGLRGKSGRPSHFDEKQMSELIKLSARTLLRALNDDELPTQFKADLAAKIYVKAMPQNIDMGGSLQPVFNITITPNKESKPNRLAGSPV